MGGSIEGESFLPYKKPFGGNFAGKIPKIRNPMGLASQPDPHRVQRLMVASQILIRNDFLWGWILKIQNPGSVVFFPATPQIKIILFFPFSSGAWEPKRSPDSRDSQSRIFPKSKLGKPERKERYNRSGFSSQVTGPPWLNDWDFGRGDSLNSFFWGVFFREGELGE